MPWVELRHATAPGALGEPFDAMLVNAGVTHPQDTWLDALAPGGRLILPLTATMPALGPIGKGAVLLITKTADDPTSLKARIVTFVAIYSGIGLRDEAINEQLGLAYRKMPFPAIKRLRRDSHDRA